MLSLFPLRWGLETFFFFFGQGWLGNMIFLNFNFQVVRIAGVSHPAPGKILKF
jgi:hypothetical protein